jgi:hypothetical protein
MTTVYATIWALLRARVGAGVAHAFINHTC